jgi:naphthalene 1,2-dioxygenase ferredoxin component
LADNENWVPVANSDELSPGEMKAAKIGDADVAVYNIGGTFYATGNVCTHALALLTDGFLDGDVVECPLHAGAFDVKTGKAVCAPVTEDVKTYPTRLVGNAVQIRIG